MFPSTACTFFASAVLLLATPGCVVDSVEAADRSAAVNAAPRAPEAGQQVHRMFDGEKQNATVSELPAQF